jgi:hypothetical protein
LLNVFDGENVSVEFRFLDGLNVSLGANASVAGQSAACLLFAD